MKSLQEKFFQTLEKRLVGYGLELVVEPNYANTGRAHVASPDHFKVLAAFTYHFQPGHNTFTVVTEGGKELFFLAQRPEELEKVYTALFDQVRDARTAKEV